MGIDDPHGFTNAFYTLFHFDTLVHGDRRSPHIYQSIDITSTQPAHCPGLGTRSMRLSLSWLNDVLHMLEIILAAHYLSHFDTEHLLKVLLFIMLWQIQSA